ncbi:MAG: 23S rRNA (adenine(2503)-C(2))-methyltransferase RlmN, partial [Sarcina sp.]
MINILDLSLQDLQNWAKENNESAFRAKQIFGWVYKNVFDFKEMKNIPKNLQNKLEENFYIGVPKVIECLKSNEDGTMKLLVAFKDGNVVECVIMR